MKIINNFAKYVCIFMTGSTFANLLWHFRIKKPILLRELLLDLQTGGTPFLDWFYLDVGFLVLLWGIYIIGTKLINRNKIIKSTRDREFVVTGEIK